LDAAILDQGIEHTPGERAMGAAPCSARLNLLTDGFAYGHFRAPAAAARFLGFGATGLMQPSSAVDGTFVPVICAAHHRRKHARAAT